MRRVFGRDPPTTRGRAASASRACDRCPRSSAADARRILSARRSALSRSWSFVYRPSASESSCAARDTTLDEIGYKSGLGSGAGAGSGPNSGSGSEVRVESGPRSGSGPGLALLGLGLKIGSGSSQQSFCEPTDPPASDERMRAVRVPEPGRCPLSEPVDSIAAVHASSHLRCALGLLRLQLRRPVLQRLRLRLPPPAAVAACRPCM